MYIKKLFTAFEVLEKKIKNSSMKLKNFIKMKLSIFIGEQQK